MNINYGEIDCLPQEMGYNPARIDDLNELIKRMIDDRQLQSASYQIRKDGKIIACSGIGKLRFDEETEMMPDSIRRIASATKIYTSVAIMQLVEKGLICVDDPVCSILDEFNTNIHKAVTIKHLMTHTSGVFPDPGCMFEPYPASWEFRNEKDWIKALLKGLPACQPGTQWIYSTSCFLLLGEIVSRVSGMKYENFVTENIIRPLKMDDTFFVIPDEKKPKFCYVNKWQKESLEKVREDEPEEYRIPDAGGGLNSTVVDMGRMGQMLLNYGNLDGALVLGRKTVEAMTRNQLNGVKAYCWNMNGSEKQFGLGIDLVPNDHFMSKNTFEHEGAGRCGIYVDPDEKLVFSYIVPHCDGVDWVPRAAANMRNIVWSGII
ncbi:MAG: serine hydrolase domain-containing protein [Saccharofermentanales bacterium]